MPTITGPTLLIIAGVTDHVAKESKAIQGAGTGALTASLEDKILYFQKLAERLGWRASIHIRLS